LKRIKYLYEASQHQIVSEIDHKGHLVEEIYDLRQKLA